MIRICFIILLIICLLFISYKKREGLNDSQLNGIDIIYWINLDRSHERKDLMNEMFKDEVFKGIPNERISAVDGENEELVYSKFKTDNYNQEGTKEYACLLSHMDAINTFNKSKYDVALILEDDCTLELKKYWTKSIKDIINNAPKDWEIIMLNYIILPGNEHPFLKWKKDSDYTNVLSSGTLSYIINKKGSKKLINLSDNMYVLNEVHHVADAYVYVNTITYCYKYPMFIYKKDNNSYISDVHNGINEYARDVIIKNYESIM